jgi:[ribosomal protein S5]-alanine N-acetyltransferase
VAAGTAAALPVLVTPRLRLRGRVPADAAALHPSMADPVLMRWWSHPPHPDVARTRDHFAGQHPDWRAWAITPAGQDVAIGFVAAGRRRAGVAEIGYLLARAHWGRGLAGEAVGAVIDRLFADGNRRVFADTDPDNRASRALLERLGFRLEGMLRAEWETHIGVRDTALYGLLRDEWRRPT